VERGALLRAFGEADGGTGGDAAGAEASKWPDKAKGT